MTRKEHDLLIEDFRRLSAVVVKTIQDLEAMNYFDPEPIQGPFIIPNCPSSLMEYFDE